METRRTMKITGKHTGECPINVKRGEQDPHNQMKNLACGGGQGGGPMMDNEMSNHEKLSNNQ